MAFDDWILALHLLSAFALVGALTIFSIGIVALRSADTPGPVLALGPAMKVGQISVGIGTAGTVVFGVWLAIALDAYQLWDLWIILALIGWAIASDLGRRVGVVLGGGFKRAGELAAAGGDAPNAELAATFRSSQVQTLHWASTAITLLILIDMIWKPGA